MASRRGGTIDSIKVGLGIDMSQLEKDIKGMRRDLQKEVTVTPQIGAVNRNDATDWLKGLDKLVNAGNAKKVKVPLDFDSNLAINNYKATIRQVEGQVKPVTVPVHFRAEAMANPGGLGSYPDGGDGGTPMGGGGGGGTRPSGGGGRGGPAKGRVSTAATSPEERRIAELEQTLGELTETLDGLAGGGAGGGDEHLTRAEKRAQNKEAHRQKQAAQEAERKANKAKAQASKRPEDRSSDVYEVIDPAGEERGEAERQKMAPGSKPSGRYKGTPQPLQMVEPGGATSEEREAARGRRTTSGGSDIGRQRDSQPPRPVWNRDTNQWEEGTGHSTADSESGSDIKSRALDRLQGQSFGSTAEFTSALEKAVMEEIEESGAAEGKPSAIASADKPRRRRFDDMSPSGRKARLGKEQTKAKTILDAASRIERYTEASGGLDPESKEFKANEAKINRALARLEDIAPGLGEAFTERNVSKARQALMATRYEDELKTPKQRQREQKNARKRFSEGSRTDIQENITDYPAEFALESLMGSLFTAPTAKKREGIAAADETGKGNAPGKKGYTTAAKAREAMMREQQLATRDPKEARETITRIESLRRDPSRRNPLTESARESFQPIDIMESGKDAELTGLGSEQKEYDLAQREIKSADKARMRMSEASARPVESDRPKPAPKTFAILDEEAQARAAAEKARADAEAALSKSLSGIGAISPAGGKAARRKAQRIDYSADIQSMRRTPMSMSSEVRPFDISTQKPFPTSVYEALLEKRGMAMGGSLRARMLPAQIQAAYDAGNIEEGQRLQKELEQMRGGWGEPEKKPEVAIPMSPFMQRLRAGMLDPKDMSGRAMGGYEQGQRWYRGGSSNQDLWNPGMVAGRATKEAYSTMGSGLYMTDEASAAKYAQVRVNDPRDDGTKQSIGGSPVVESRKVDIDPASIKDFSSGRFDDLELLDAWDKYLADYIRENQDANWLKTAGPQSTRDDIATWREAQKHGNDQVVTASGQRLQHQSTLHHKPGKAPTLRQAIGSNYGVNQPLFAAFMQSRGYQGLLTREGGEGAGFEHPSLVIFDPKNKNLQRYMGGWAQMQRGGNGRPSSLSDLPGVLANAESITEVGEQGREAIVGLKGGGSFVVPNHQLGQFKKMVGMASGGWMDDPWEGESPADLDGSGADWREDPYEGEDPRDEEATAPPRRRRSRPARARDWRAGGAPRGRFSFKGSEGQEITEAQQGGTIAGSGEVQRVYVVNMPEGGMPLGAPKEEERPERPEPRPVASGAPASGGGVRSEGRVASDDEILAAERASEAIDAGSTRRGRLAPRAGSAEGSAAKFEGERRLTDMRDALDQVGINISEALQKSPVRALSVAMGQIAQTVVGGRAGILERSARARALGRRAESAYGQLSQAETQVAGLETLFEGRYEGVDIQDPSAIRRAIAASDASDKQKERELEGVDELEEQRRRAREVRPIAQERLAEATKASETILTPGQQFRSQAVGLAGIVGGTVLFTAAMGAAQKGLELIGMVSSDAYDAMTDFSVTAKATAKELGEAVRQASGDISGAFAGYAAGTGLAAGVDVSAAQRQAGIRGGASAFQQQRDLLRTQDFYANRTGATPGLGVGFGDGLLGTFIGQQQGIAELTASRLEAVDAPSNYSREQVDAALATSGMPEQRSEADFAGGIDEYAQRERERYLRSGASDLNPDSVFAFDPARSWDEFLERAGTGLLQSGIEPTEAGVRGLGDEALRDAILNSSAVSGMPGLLPPDQDLRQRLFRFEQPVSAGGGGGVAAAANTGYAAYLEEEAQKKQKLIGITDDLNESLEKVGSQFEFVIDPDRAEDFREVLNSRAVGAGSYSGTFADRNLVGVNRQTGEVVNDIDANRLLQDLSDSALQPTFEGLLEEMRRGTTASLDAQRRQFDLQKQLIPANFAQQYIARPLPQRDTAGILGSGAPDSIAGGAAAQYTGQIREVRTELTQLAQEGRRELRALGVPKEAIDSVADLGAEITNLQTSMSDMQLDLEQAQYNEQIRISARGIGDLLALNNKQAMSVGDQVIGATRLGELQRAQINDQRELSRIQLARSQRELNLQLALSRLRSPGETPEERAVRRREAELLAQERQRELDIGKRSTGRGFEIQDIQYARQLEDAVAQLQLLQQGRDVSISVRGIQRLIEAKQQLLQVKQQYLDVPAEAGKALRQATIGIVATIQSRLGRITDAQVEAISDYVDGINEQLARLGPGQSATPVTSLGAGPGKGQIGSAQGRGPNAAGFFGAVSTPTSFVAGEAGTEQVVVLRNPKSGMLGFKGSGGGGGPMSGGGGGMTLNMTINASVSNEGDEDRLVRKVVRQIHDEYALLAG